MLNEFLVANRVALIERCRAKVAARPVPKATPAQLDHGIPMFLDQLIVALQQATRAPPAGGAPGPRAPDTSEIGASAMRHGMELAQQGYSIEHVVRDYGDLCQAVTELAVETGTAIAVREFRILNLCLDEAIAAAVAEFSARHEAAIVDANLRVADEDARVLLQELQGHVETAGLAITAIKAGNVGLKGATGAILDLSVISLRTRIARALAGTEDVRDGRFARH